MSQRFCKTLLTLLLSSGLLTASAAAQRGARVKMQDLDELMSQATEIVRGTVASTRVEPHRKFPNLMTVVVTFRVEKALKGEGSQQIQFRQYIWDVRDLDKNAIYKRGERLLLMLGPTSRYGLRSPVGLGQGRFKIHCELSGEETAVNEMGNVGLFATPAARTSATQVRLSAKASRIVAENRGGPINLDDLERIVQSAAKNSAAKVQQ
jgi:hypothetical protein